MNIKTVSVSRKFNLGNYESLDLYIEADLAANENPKEALAILRDNLEMTFAEMQRIKPNPTEAPKMPMQLANENQTKREAAKPNSAPSIPQENICPVCGMKKQPQYPVCYSCHMKEQGA
jgi:hypothetical protein